jgi:metal-responsive CopG/Arc/MetJ family transcriptional regulator
VKTAISVPDEVFASVDASAARLGVSRSRFFTQAAEFYLHALDQAGLTERVNRALREEPEASKAESKAFVAASTAAMRARWDADPW